jgi:hypothetical protein
MLGDVDSLLSRSGRSRGIAALCSIVAINGLSAPILRAEEPPIFPSKVILGLRATCMTTCQEKEAADACTRYCDCHLFELRRDLSDSQVESLLLTAERGGTGADRIRGWLHASARLCEKRVFGSEGDIETHPGEGAALGEGQGKVPVEKKAFE